MCNSAILRCSHLVNDMYNCAMYSCAASHKCSRIIQVASTACFQSSNVPRKLKQLTASLTSAFSSHRSRKGAVIKRFKFQVRAHFRAVFFNLRSTPCTWLHQIQNWASCSSALRSVMASEGVVQFLKDSAQLSMQKGHSNSGLQSSKLLLYYTSGDTVQVIPPAAMVAKLP
jgi:hypothetical protein